MSLRAYALFAQLVWLACWAGAQLLVERMGPAMLPVSLYAFTVGYAALAGVALPLWGARRYGLRLSAPTAGGRRGAGIAALTVAVLAGLFGSGAAQQVVAEPPSGAVLVKYFFLFAPMAAGITLHAFFLLPRGLAGPQDHLRPTTLALAVGVSALSVGAGFWADQLFRSVDLAGVQLVLGLFLGLGAALSRSALWTYFAYLLIMQFNTLEEAKYFDFPWAPLVAGFIVSTAALVAYGAATARTRTRRPPGS
ncbi:MAG: hypothetical protein KC933_18530 [Myxococcales bacterium]|nr:hypothetical protein [Myxococcales bacterium]